MIVVISTFEVANGMETEVKKAFLNRPKLVENAEGFIRMEVISPFNNPSEIKVVTYWKTEGDFEIWHKHRLKESHNNIPKGLKLVPNSWNLIKYQLITD